MSAARDFLAIVGVTTAGKTALSLAVAERLDGEIVSMDSRQVYRGMDIGTDKVGRAERERVPHFGLDLVDPEESYSAGRFARDARRWIAGIRDRGRVPVLAGGTGFFLRALTHPLFRQPELDPSRRDALRSVLDRQPRERLERWVEVLDPERAAVAAEGGPQRLSRTLEIALLTGRPLSWWHRSAPADAEPLAGTTVLLEIPRQEADRRIEERVRRMVDAGLVDEVEGLLAAGTPADAPGMSGTGYREVARYLSGACSLEEALDRTVRATRRYARRQITWFRNHLPAGVVRVDGLQPLDEQVERVVECWERGGGGS